MKVVAYKGFDNVEVFSISQNKEPFNLSDAGFTSAKVIAENKSIDAFISGNEISATLGDLDLFAGEYEGKVVVYSDVYPDGLVIMGWGLPDTLQIKMKS